MAKRIQLLREVTEWDYSNHDYMIVGERLFAYRRKDTDAWMKFSKTMHFSKSRRKFKVLNEEVPSNFIPLQTKDPRTFESLEVFMA